MNWFTQSNVTHTTLEQKKKEIQEHGGCEHVEANPELLYRISYENDSWGREGYCLCEACAKQADEEEGKEQVVCHDCKQSFEKKDTFTWKWYDFYAPQGDIPLTICNGCRTGQTHVHRVARDREDRLSEFPDDDY